jgi:hypothetical protein
MARKQRTYYPKKNAAPAPTDRVAPPLPRSVAVINTAAGVGKPEIKVGARVVILGTGLFAGETAVVERLVAGVIPAAVVRTEAGRTRQVRTIDLDPVRTPAPSPADAEPAPPTA